MEIPKQNFLIFQEMEFSNISGNRNPEKLLIFQEVKSFLYFLYSKEKLLVLYDYCYIVC